MDVNLKTFPQLGAYSGEVGSGLSPGGIGGPWFFNYPLNYWWNFGSKRSKRKSKRSKRKQKRSKRKLKRTKRSKQKN